MSERHEIERLYVSAVLYDNGILSETIVRPEMLTKFRPVMEAIVEMSKAGPVDFNAMITRPNIDAMLLASLEPFTAATWKHYEIAIHEAWGADVVRVATAESKSKTLPEMVEILDRALASVAMSETASRTKRLGDLLVPALERIAERARLRGEIPGIPFGLDAVDAATLGANPGQLIVIAARPSQGKSAIMAQFAAQQAHRFKVGIVTIESGEAELTQRIITQVSQVDGRKLSGGLTDGRDTARVRDAVLRLEAIKDNLFIHDQPGIRLAQLASVARRMVRDGVQILYVDYLQLVRVPGKESRREEVAEVSSSLKALARELHIPIVALAQLSRDSDERRPTMGDCQHSSQIEQDADQVWLLWHRRDKDGVLMNSRIILDKVRDGQTLDVFVDFIRPYLTFLPASKSDGRASA